MAKATPLPEYLFSLREIELGCRLPLRGAETLHRAGLLQEPALKARRGGRPGWDFEALGRAALIGALHRSMTALLASARLANAISDEWAGEFGKLPSLIDRQHKIGFYLRGEDAHEDWRRSDVATHRTLREHPEIYVPYAPLRDDLFIVIADRSWVLDECPIIQFLSPFSFKRAKHSPRFRIDQWDLGPEGNIKLLNFIDILGPEWAETGYIQGTPAQINAAWQEKQALDALERSVSTIRINVSLSIRSALDRIYDARNGVESNNAPNE